MKRAIFCFLSALALLLLSACGAGGETAELSASPAYAAPTAVPTPEPTPTTAPTPLPTPTPVPYVSPIDFDALRERNPHIYAWLRIDGTNIDYPVVQNPEDDGFYLYNDADGNPSVNGAVFTEHWYNGLDFTDPVTVLYGHHMRSGEIFGYLEDYFTDDEFFASGPVIRIYLPEEELDYPVFAAVPFTDEHILYQRDFGDPEVFTAFFQRLLASDSPWANVDPARTPRPGDRVVILSTCYYNGDGQRYLVMGALPVDDPSPEPASGETEMP